MKKYIIYLIIVILISGCAPEKATQMTVVSPTEGPESRKSIATITLTNTALPFPSFSTSTPEPTYYPEMDSVAAREKISKLMNSTKTCKLPCYWGIIPGKTIWHEALDIQQGIIGDEFMTSGYLDKTSFQEPVYLQDLGYREDYEIDFYVVDNVVDLMWVRPKNTRMVFNISSIFKRYGPPEEVKIGTQSNYSGEIAQLPFTVLLEYPSKKTIFQFAFEGKVNGDMILGCIDNSLNPDIVMWSNHPEFVAPIFSSNPDYFKPIKDVSDQTIDELFNGVVDKGRYCLKTPTNKWPSGLN